jgi:rRNA N6-adenosine-methyltransferase METTL5
MFPVNKLENIIDRLEGFPNPKVLLEQYATDSHVASRLTYLIETEFSAIKDKIILDLGCGTGSLSFTSTLFDPLILFSVDIDPENFPVFMNNFSRMKPYYEQEPFIECILADAVSISKFIRISFDSVITNPPFGTKNNSGIDDLFVTSGLAVSNSVFSLHKSSTRTFFLKKRGAKLLAQISFRIPNQFHFHKLKENYIEVDLLHFQKNNLNFTP